MKYMSTKEAENKWDISERRIRKLLEENRIEGALKVGSTWIIPDNVSKPIDMRTIKDGIHVDFDIDSNYFDKVDELKNILDSKRPFSSNTLKSIKENFNLVYTYNSNGIEGNTLTLRETQIVLDGMTVGGKSMKEHLEAINHSEATNYLDKIVKDDDPINEWNIKSLHSIILKNIDDNNAGRYRMENVFIKGALHVPPSYINVPEQMRKLIFSYHNWDIFHPIIKAALLHGELVKIHPFIDGNGRTSRLVMNLSLMHDGYNPIIIKKENRIKYYEALDKAHTTSDYTDFIKFICEEEKNSLVNYLSIIG